MDRFGIDQDALIAQFSQATAQQGEALRNAVHEATLGALRGRELTLKSIRDVVKAVMQAASAGAAQNTAADDIEALLSKAMAGMDGALVQAVEANRRALQQVVDQGVTLRETQLEKAMSDIGNMEEMFFSTIQKAAAAAAGPLKGPWADALTAAKRNGTATGTSATNAIEQLTARAQAAARDGRALGQRAALVLLEHHAALASGVLIGMSEAMTAGKQPPPTRKR
jgi:hypothetical protein